MILVISWLKQYRYIYLIKEKIAEDEANIGANRFLGECMECHQIRSRAVTG